MCTVCARDRALNDDLSLANASPNFVNQKARRQSSYASPDFELRRHYQDFLAVKSTATCNHVCGLRRIFVDHVHPQTSLFENVLEVSCRVVVTVDVCCAVPLGQQHYTTLLVRQTVAHRP